MARAGILAPSRGARREYRFTFQDLVLLRTARGLLDAAVPGRRVHRTLRQLVKQLPAGRSPSEVQLSAVDGRVLAVDGDQVWVPESGQMLLPFASAAPVEVTSLAPQSAVALYNLGTALDAEGDFEGAIQAYRQALSADPGMADAHYNLSLLYQQTGHKLAAVMHLKRYRELVQSD